MFTWSIRGGYKFSACHEESVKYQTCLIFLQSLLTLVSNPNFSPIATGLSVNLMACRLHLQVCRLSQQACLSQVSGLSQIWTWFLVYLGFDLLRDNLGCSFEFSLFTFLEISLSTELGWTGWE